MTDSDLVDAAVSGRNFVVFSDGTGQDGQFVQTGA
jgi:hypothetical protein